MSLKESEDFISVDNTGRKGRVFSTSTTNSEYSRRSRLGKSATIDISDDNTSDLQSTKVPNETPVDETKPTVLRNLRKTSSFGGINLPSSSKAVLKRWTSLLDEEENNKKRHSSSSISERSRGEKVSFRPVSSILLSTPWEKYFKGNDNRLGAEAIQKAADKSKTNRTFDTDKLSGFNPNSCFVNKREGSEECSGSHVAENISVSSGFDTGETSQISNETRARVNIDIENQIGGIITGQQSSTRLEVSRNDNLDKYEVIKHTAIPRKEDYEIETDRISSKQSILRDRKGASSIGLVPAGSPHEDMSLQAGSSYLYKSKYGAGLTSNEPVIRRGTSGAYYTRRAPDTSYTNAFKINRTINAVESGKETVAEVDAYISAYKSRRERSFEYGDAEYRSYVPTRTHRKSSFDNSPLSFQSQATRTYAPSYTSQMATPSYRATHTAASDCYSLRNSRYSTKSDRSRSFDTEPPAYSSFARAGSWGRSPRRSASSGSSAPSSRAYSPPEKASLDDPYNPEIVSPRTRGTASILSSDALSPSEKEFFSTSRVIGTPVDTDKVQNSRRTSLLSRKLQTVEKDSSPKNRPLSAIGNHPRETASNEDRQRGKSALIDADGESELSSRSRIMGGILSMFFTDDEPTTENRPSSIDSTGKVTKRNSSSVDDFAGEKPSVETGPQDGNVGTVHEGYGRIGRSVGDSTYVTESSPSVTSADGNRSVSKSEEMVQVKSVLVEEHRMGRDKEDASSHKVKTNSVDGAKGSRDGREVENIQQQRERRSSWFGRSLRKISSPTKHAVEEPLEKTEKPKRERRRSLLWRLGRDPKSTDVAESSAERKNGSKDVGLNNSCEKKEERKIRKEERREEKKEEKKEEKREEKKEDKGIVSYLRRSSRRKKSQVCEKEILEARQDIHVKPPEEISVIGTPVVRDSIEVSQSVTDAPKTITSVESQSHDLDRKPDVSVINKSNQAPLAQVEGSDDDMVSVNIRKSRFAQVLQNKEEAGTMKATKEIQRTEVQSNRPDTRAQKSGANSTSSYLSSKFMKSRTMFEGGNEKTSSDLRQDNSGSKAGGLRRSTQEATDSKVSSDDQHAASVCGKKTLLQRSNTSDVIRSSDRARVPLRERNKKAFDATAVANKSEKILAGSSADDSSVNAKEEQKEPVRRLLSDSVVNSKTALVYQKGRKTGRESDREREVDLRVKQGKGKVALEDEKSLITTREETVDRKNSGDMNAKKLTIENKTDSEVNRKYRMSKRIGDDEKESNPSAVPPEVRIEKTRKEQGLSSGNSPREMKNENVEVGVASCETSKIKAECHNEVGAGIKSGNNAVEEASLDLQGVNVKQSVDSNVKQQISSDSVEYLSGLSAVSSHRQVTETAEEENESKEVAGERLGSRRRRERRAYRAKQVDPFEIEKMKEQMRREGPADEVEQKQLGTENEPREENERKLECEYGTEVRKDIAPSNAAIDDEKNVEKDLPVREEKCANDVKTGVKLDSEKKSSSVDSNSTVDGKVTETDTGDESAGSTSSATKLTTKSVIKEKIRQKKFDKQLRKERTMSLPVGVEIVLTPATEIRPVLDSTVNGAQSPLLRTKPPMVPRIQRSQDADDIPKMQKKVNRPLRSRPKTLTQGIDPSLLINDIKAKEEAVVVEERLSISQLKQRLMQSESGSRTPKTPDVQRKNKRRSGKRYKTITEGIAPGLLEAAHQLASNENDSNMLGVDHLNRLNVALSASTENLKRRSFIVSEVNSRIGSLGTSLATSMEDLSTKDNGNEGKETGGSVVEESIKKLKKLPMVVDSDEDDPMPSVLSLKQKFLQAVEDSYKPAKRKVSKRAKGKQRDRPFTISGLDDTTMKQLKHSIDERSEYSAGHHESGKALGDEKVKIEIQEIKREKMDEIGEDELENMLTAEGLTADQLASELGINPSLAQGSPLRSRKPFLGTTAEESPTEVLEAIHETNEKQGEETKSLGELRNQFMSAMNDFRSGSLDKGKEEESEETVGKKERRIGIACSSDGVPEREDEPKSDLDFVSQNVTQLQSITDRRHIKPHRKQRSSANPVKTLQARGDLITEIGSNKGTENSDKVAKSDRGLSSAGLKLWRKVALASEAKAALQSTEDFSKVKLKKVKAPGQSVNGEPAETGGVVESSVTNLLLKVKGRRHVQIHVVDFNTNSLARDDSFVIVTPKELLCWHGLNANVIEKAKASEIASRINQKKEMGCKAFDVVYMEQGGQNESKIFKLLNSEGQATVQDQTEDDEEYERRMMNTSMTYSLQDSDPPELIPVYDMCQRAPSKDILKNDEAFVFDFMSEVYVWIGRQTTSGLRKKIMKLARETFDQGYCKPPSATTPIHHGKSRKISLTATELPTRKQSINRKLSVQKFLHDKENLVPRPPFAIFLSMFEGAEWVIFKEKFCDWPDESRIIRMKGGPQTVGELTKKVKVSDVKPVDPLTMVKPSCDPLLPTFEGTEIDRGHGKPKGPDGYHIITRCVQVWHVTERSRTLLPQTSNGQFHSGEGYVIRWEYSIVASRVMKMLKDIEEAKASGRHRCAYFFWLGNDCAVTEQGATAVMTVDLDEERGPHVRVIQGKEPACFLNLFDGGMIIHAGKRKSKQEKATFSDRSIVRFYCVRNEVPGEACLLQVPVSAISLRSRSSFVMVLCKQGEIFLWHGCKSSDASRATAIQAAHRFIENHPEEALLAEREQMFLTEIEEGHEPEVFWVALGGEDDYGSLLTDLNTKWDFVPRCFHLTSATGQFIANEITNPSIYPKDVCPFPFLQDDLYDAYQPAIFIIDAIHEVYLWLGWWPEDEESENSDAQRMRWDVDKRKAMESVVLFAKEAGRSLSHCYVVDAGLEPDQFTHLFPYWIVQEDITEIQLEDGRVDSDKLQLITKKLEGFTREFFSIDELVQRPLPEGVNPSKLETYLSDDDFNAMFQMSRDHFNKLPIWRRDNIKKKAGLY